MHTKYPDNFVIDFHTHILPGIDDGSRNSQESLGLWKVENQQNVDCIVATPHFYADNFSVEEFLMRRDESVQKLREAMAQSTSPMPKTLVSHVGAEVYFFPGMGKAEKLNKLCIKPVSLNVQEAGTAGTDPEGETASDLILIEMPFVQWNNEVYSELEDVLERQELRVVLAHVERYPQFQKDDHIWNKVMRLPVTIQINGGSFLKSRARRKLCLELLKTKDRVVLGSDCHNLSSRLPNLEEARKVIAKKLGQDRLALIDKTASVLLDSIGK